MHAWEQIQQTLDYIENHLGGDIRMEQLANMASLSLFYYQRLFTRLVKKPPAEYIRLRRLAKAAEALLEKDTRILDVALELGFSSHEHFTRSFKAAFGITPNQYRRHPQTLNRMTKPELLLHYVLIDEGVPLITDGIVLEINRRQVLNPVDFIGLEKKMPVQFVDGLGTESGVDPLGALWQARHVKKRTLPGLAAVGEEVGVAYPCPDARYFYYFAGAKCGSNMAAEGYTNWRLPKGEYIVCSFEAECFEALVMDALYKAQQYLFATWLPSHELRTEAFCAERYASHGPGTTSMEVWLKQEEQPG